MLCEVIHEVFSRESKTKVSFILVENLGNYCLLCCRESMGLFRLLKNIEDDFITSNSAVAFTVSKTSNFLYQDRHGNWVVGE